MPVRPKKSTASPSKPASTKRPVADEDDEYEEDDDDEAYAPPKSKGSKSSKSKRARDEDDEDDDDADEEDDDRPELQGGWGSYKRKRAESSNYPNNLQLGPDPALIRFLENEPLVSFNQHWIEREGKKSFVCCAPDQDCPLCALGDGIRTMNVFNVLRIDGGEPANLILQAGVKLSDILVKKSERTALMKGYWSIARTGKGGNTNFDVQSVKERDLEEDWDVQPIDDDVLDKAKKAKWSKEAVVQRPTRKDLLAIAKELTGDYDRD